MRWLRRSVVVEGTSKSRRRASRSGVRVEGLERRTMLDCATTAYAAGALDPNFGSGGKAVTPAALKSAVVADVAIQKNGKIVEAGFVLNQSVLNINPDSQNTSISVLKGAWFVARFNPDGKSLDPTFGQGGIVVTHVIPGDVEGASRLLIEPDGKLLVGGITALTTDANGSPALVRYNPNGSLDTTFGSGGVVTAPLSVFSSGVTALALDGNTILVGGGNDNAYTVVRLTSDGTPDAAFGDNGVASVQLAGPGGFESNDQVRAIAVGKDGTIDAAGSTASLPGSNLTDQAIVVGFSDAGAVVRQQVVSLGTGAGGDDSLTALTVEPDGTLLAQGSSTAQDTGTGSPPTTAVLTRLNPDLSPVTGFGTGGVVRLPAGGITALLGSSPFVVQADGSIVALTGAGLARVNSAGQLDPTFGTNGVVSLTSSATQKRLSTGLAVDPATGGYVVAGNVLTFVGATSSTLSVTVQPTLERFLARSLTVMTPVFGPGTVHGLLVNAPKGRSFTHPVALVTLSASAAGCFTASDYRTTIFWGDGTSSRGAIVSGPFRTGVVGTHRYGHQGVYHTTIVVASAATGAVLTTANGLIAAGVRIPHRGLVEIS